MVSSNRTNSYRMKLVLTMPIKYDKKRYIRKNSRMVQK